MVDKEDIEKAFNGEFIDYALLKIESYGCHYTSRMEWDEIKRLVELGRETERAQREAKPLRHGFVEVGILKENEWIIVHPEVPPLKLVRGLSGRYHVKRIQHYGAPVTAVPQGPSTAVMEQVLDVLRRNPGVTFSRSELASLCRTTQQSMLTALTDLAKNGLVSTTKRPGGLPGRRTARRYYI